MKIKTPVGIGFSSVLVIFAVLCLTVFSLLCVATVKADGRLAEKSHQAVFDSYAADGCAEKILAELRTGIVPDGVQCENGVYTFSCAQSKTQILCVSVKCTDTDYEILQWQTKSTAQWQADEKLHVFQPGDEKEEK